MENIILLRLLIDFGLLILIWLVQLIIYPSLCAFTNKTDLWKWHSIYMRRISYVVIPLMIGQVAICLWQLINEMTLYATFSGILILSVWVLTFSIFVPLHQQIVKQKKMQEAASSLVSKNWWRTLIWTVLFLLSFYEIMHTKFFS